MSSPEYYPSWRKSALKKSRSLTSMHRLLQSGEQQPQDREQQNKSRSRARQKKSVSSWAPSWLLTPTSNRLLPGKTTTTPTTSQPLLVCKTPILTLILMRLEEKLPQFCQLLSDPTIEQAAAASAVLEDNDNNASVVANSLGKSPFGFEGEWEKHVSPLLLLAGAEAIYAQMQHVLEFDSSHYNGLLALYEKIGENLRYVKETLCDVFIGKQEDTEEKQESTDETVANAKQSPNVSSSSHQKAAYCKSATSLATSLDALMQLVEIRRRLIQFHRQHVFTTTTANDDSRANLSQQCHDIWARLPPQNQQQCGATLVLVKSVASEIKAMAATLAMAYHLERCSFLDTVLNARKLKVHMRAAPSTVLQMWFHNTLELFLSAMPIFFDRVDAFATPLYGFDKKCIVQQEEVDGGRPQAVAAKERVVSDVHDYDSSFLDFLRRHESKGGSPMAVSVILDAVRLSNFHVERGFHGATGNSNSNPDRTLQEEWQAVYMRTTIHSGSAGTLAKSPSGGASNAISSIMSRSGFRHSQNVLKVRSKRDIISGEEGHHALSQSSLRRVWSGEAKSASPQHRKRKKDANLNALEYAPDSGRPSWPHIEWDVLVPILAGKKTLSVELEQSGGSSTATLGQAVTYRASAEPNPKTESFALRQTSSGEHTASVAGSPVAVPSPLMAGASPEPGTKSPRSTHRDPSSLFSVYHVLRLSEYTWIVVIVKGEGEAKWHIRRARGHTDEEIRSFLNDMSGRLRPSSVFCVESVLGAKTSPKLSRSSRTIDLASFWKGGEWKDVETHVFLDVLKEKFGLRPQSPMREPLRSPYQRGLNSRNTNRGTAARMTEETQSMWALSVFDDTDRSALALFLGPELSSVLQ